MEFPGKEPENPRRTSRKFYKIPDLIAYRLKKEETLCANGKRGVKGDHCAQGTRLTDLGHERNV